MADNLTGNPLIIDSTGAKRAADAKGANVHIKRIHWNAATTAGHVAEITDAAGAVKWRHTVAGANANIQEDFSDPDGGLHMNGLTVSTLGSGVLYIYC